MAHSSGARGQSVGGRAECGLRSTAGCPHHGGWPHADERGGGGKADVGGYCGLDSDESGCPRRAWTARGHQQRSGPPQDTAALQGAVGGSGDGRRAGELIFGPAVPSTRRHNWYFAAATPGGRLTTRRGAVCRAAGSASWLLWTSAVDSSWRGVALENGLGRSRAMRAKDARRPWRSAHPCRRSGDVYSRGRVLRCNLLPWGWYGEWEQDDDEAKATLERWVMGVRSRRNGAHRGRA